MEKEIDIFENVLEYISRDVRRILKAIPEDVKGRVEEIRLRNGSPLNIYLDGKDFFITKASKMSRLSHEAYIVDGEDINNSFQLITNHSVYAFSEDIRKGYITIRGGHRVGIGGKVVYNKEGIEFINTISSLNIRIARQKKGVSNHLLPYLIDKVMNPITPS